MTSGTFTRAMQVQLANLFAETFAFGFIYLVAIDEGHSEVSVALFIALMYGTAALATALLLRPLDTRRSMLLGFGLRAASLIVAMNVVWYGNLLAVAALTGVFIALFWIPYNVVFMRATSASDRAGRSTALFALFAVSFAVFPLVGGIAIDIIGWTAVLVVAVLALVPGGVLLATSDWGPAMDFNLRRAFGRGRHLAHVVGLEGLWQGIIWVAVPLGTIRMLDRGSEYGAFLAFLGLMSGVASVAAGRWSDRVQDRRRPLTASAVGVAAFTFVVAFTLGDLGAWSLAVGLMYFFTFVMQAFTFTLLAELGPGIDDTMGLREFMLNVGRISGGLVVIASFYLGGDLRWPLFVAAVAMLVMLRGYHVALERGPARPSDEGPPSFPVPAPPLRPL